MGHGASIIASADRVILPAEWTLEQVVVRAGEFGIGENAVAALRDKKCDGAMVLAMEPDSIRGWGLVELETDQLIRLVERCQEYQLEQKGELEAPAAVTSHPDLFIPDVLSDTLLNPNGSYDPESFDILPGRLSAPKTIEDHLKTVMQEFKESKEWNDVLCDDALDNGINLKKGMTCNIEPETACMVNLPEGHADIGLRSPHINLTSLTSPTKPTSPKSCAPTRTSSRLELTATGESVTVPLQIELQKGECTSGKMSAEISPTTSVTSSFISGSSNCITGVLTAGASAVEFHIGENRIKAPKGRIRAPEERNLLRLAIDPTTERQKVTLVDTKLGVATDVRVSEGWKAELVVVCRKATTIEIQRHKAMRTLLKAEKGSKFSYLHAQIIRARAAHVELALLERASTKLKELKVVAPNAAKLKKAFVWAKTTQAPDATTTETRCEVHYIL
jgi:hypothetical protein